VIRGVWGVQAEGEGSVVHSAALGQLREAVAQAADWEAQLRRALAKKGTSTDVDGPALLQKVNVPLMRWTAPVEHGTGWARLGMWRGGCPCSHAECGRVCGCVQVAGSLRAAVGQLRGDESGGRLFCACQQVFREAGHMIGCDLCDQW
jgi:hypothetical protein